MPTRRLPQARASPRHTAGAPLVGMPGEIFRSWQLTVATYSAARPARPLPVCAERISGPFGAMGRRWRTLHRPLANGSRPDRSAVASGVTLSRKPATGAPPCSPSPRSPPSEWWISIATAMRPLARWGLPFSPRSALCGYHVFLALTSRPGVHCVGATEWKRFCPAWESVQHHGVDFDALEARHAFPVPLPPCVPIPFRRSRRGGGDRK